MNLEIQDASDTAASEKIWTELVEASTDGWFWHTYSNFEFNLCAAAQYEVQNHSFFVTLDGKPIGLVPLLIQEKYIGDLSCLEASYYGAAMPWPCFIPGLSNLPEIETFAFDELERRASAANAERIILRLSPPKPNGTEQERFSRVVVMRHYIDFRYTSHLINLNPDTLENVRERYRRYVRKFSPHFEMIIYDGKGVDAAIEQTYFELHVKDAGGQFRSRESYTHQAGLARSGEGFYVAAKHKQEGRISGMLLVSLYKGAAYDNSVGVDPAYQDNYVSHLLKWTAIGELIKRGASTYELGDKADLPSLAHVPSRKNYGISNFKDGWARGGLKTCFIAEKYLTKRFLVAYMAEREKALEEYLGLS